MFTVFSQPTQTFPTSDIRLTMKAGRTFPSRAGSDVPAKERS